MTPVSMVRSVINIGLGKRDKRNFRNGNPNNARRSFLTGMGLVLVSSAVKGAGEKGGWRLAVILDKKVPARMTLFVPPGASGYVICGHIVPVVSFVFRYVRIRCYVPLQSPWKRLCNRRCHTRGLLPTGITKIPEVVRQGSNLENYPRRISRPQHRLVYAVW